MKIKDLSPATLAQIKATKYDRIIEKHEGPFTYKWEFMEGTKERAATIAMYQKAGADYEPEADAEFMEIAGLSVLLPVSADNHPNITLLHHFLSKDDQQLVLYIKDTTYDDSAWGAGFVAICQRFPKHSFYIATLYHEWFIIDYDNASDLVSA
ncbi:MAG: hypothetical protein AAF960_00180 [Bacteroidota bacterium]